MPAFSDENSPWIQRTEEAGAGKGALKFSTVFGSEIYKRRLLLFTFMQLNVFPQQSGDLLALALAFITIHLQPCSETTEQIDSQSSSKCVYRKKHCQLEGLKVLRVNVRTLSEDWVQQKGLNTVFFEGPGMVLHLRNFIKFFHQRVCMWWLLIWGWKYLVAAKRKGRKL